MRRMAKDISAFSLVLVAATGAVLTARQFPRLEGAHSGPGSFPLALGIVWAGLALAGLILAWRGRLPPDGEVTVPEELPRAARLLVLTAAYLWLMPVVGFISATTLLFTVALWILGYRDVAPALACGFLYGYGLFWIFGVVMRVPLPTGWIG